MKKLLLMLLMLATVFCFASCGGDSGGTVTPQPGGDDEGNAPVEYIAIVHEEGLEMKLTDIVKAIYDKNGKMLQTHTDAHATVKGEIVFGEADRSVTEEAIAMLEALIDAEPGNPDDYAAYIIYKDKAGNVAVYWNNSYVEPMVFELFASDYTNLATLSSMVSGTIYSNVFNLDDYLYDKAWSKVEAEAPADVLKALQDLNAFYDGSAIVDWMANLWEPYICACGKCKEEGKDIPCYGGAFYYANSARDYSGFLPDLESTRQLLSWMVSNGAFENYDSYAEALPEDIKNRIVAFCQACLDPNDGYFYHPQWGKSIGTARKGRDLSWGIALLEAFGVEPKYPTAADRLSGATAKYLTSPFGASVAEAVSGVTAVDAFDNSLASEESYMAWLKDITNYYGDMFVNSAGAHTINAVQDQIISAGYLEITLNYLDEQQDKLYNEMKAAYDADPEKNPAPTGLWQRTIDYNAVWGLLKFAPFYTAGDREIRYAEYGIATCVGCILIDADIKYNYHANDMMNMWSAANMLINNAQKHNPDVVPRLFEITNENAVAMIRESMAKILKFRQEDGTYGYNQGTSAPTTQGVSVSKGLPEGDVNATSLICTMYRCVFTVLGYDVVPLCDFRDGERFLETIENLESSPKLPPEKPKVIDFNDGDSEGVSGSFNNGAMEVVQRPGGASDDMALHFTTTEHGSAGDTISAKVGGSILGATCFVMEFDIYVESVDNANAAGTVFQVRIGEAMMFEVNHKDGNISLRANPTTKNGNFVEPLNISFPTGEWANIRLEYYLDDAKPTTKVFYNGTLAATTHSYWIGDGATMEGTVPKNTYTQGRFFALRAVTASLYLDNILCYADNSILTDSTVPNDTTAEK